MTIDSTILSRTPDMKERNIESPRPSSLIFIRQFARVYMSYGSSEFSTMIAN